ncbi:hypothetical protein [Streptomyces sp. NPDC014623]|uniref:hypothetical protein n=1 Tax=Streptomyces sp. NPDC014623 TaxID=3364875 RepID=UPI00370021F3
MHLPAQRTVFSGDAVSSSTRRQPGGHPVRRAGPLSKVAGPRARVPATGAEVIVPGHGPVPGPAGVREHTGCLAYVRESAHVLHTAGSPAAEAARRVIDEGRHPAPGLPERLVVAIGSEHRYLDGSELPGSLRMTADVAAASHGADAACTGGRA